MSITTTLPSGSEWYAVLAREAWEHQQFEEALKSVRRLLESAPNYLPAHQLLLDIYLAQEDWPSAQQALEQSMAQLGEQDSLLVYRARLASLTQDAAQAEQLFGQLLQNPQPDCAVRIGYYKHLLLHDQQISALKQVQALEQLTTQDPEQARQTAEFLLDIGRPHSAGRLIGQFTVSEANPALQLTMARYFRGINEPKYALAIYRHLLRLSPRQPLVQYYLGLTLLEAGELEEAPNWMHLLEQHPQHNQRVRHIQANWLAARGETTLAENVYRKLIEENPNNRHFRAELARLLSRQNRQDEARQVLEDALSHHEEPNLQYLLGLVQLQLKQPEKAVDPLLSALDRLPARTDIYLALTSAYEMQGLLENAQSIYNHAMKLKLGSPELYARYYDLLSKLSKTGEALELLDRIEDLPESMGEAAGEALGQMSGKLLTPKKLGRMLYFKAMFTARLYQKRETLDLLRRAISLLPSLAEEAQEEESFSLIKQEPEFQTLTRGVDSVIQEKLNSIYS